jgi:hypothetical protein
MQRPAHTTLANQGITGDQGFRMGPIRRKKQQHASGALPVAALAICPITADRLMARGFKAMEPSQMGRNDRIKLRL